MANEPEELLPELRALFDSYPQPNGDAQFDARFWRELDARQNRYRGLPGFARRLVEVEIEGIAVWRLGLSLFGGAAVCALGVTLLSLSATPTNQAPSQIAEMPLDPLASPRFARELWDERDFGYPARVPIAPRREQPKGKEEFSCVSFAHDLA